MARWKFHQPRTTKDEGKRAQQPLITVGLLKLHLAGYADDMLVDFSGLDFYRLKQRSPTTVQVEFDQTVYRDARGDVVVDNH